MYKNNKTTEASSKRFKHLRNHYCNLPPCSIGLSINLRFETSIPISKSNTLHLINTNSKELVDLYTSKSNGSRASDPL